MQIPKSVEIIEYNAFKGCASLKRIILPDSLKEIVGDFEDCKSIEEIILPKSSKYRMVGVRFKGCESLNTIHSLADEIAGISIENNTFDGINMERCTLYVPSGTRWAYRHHDGFGKFKNIEIEKILENVEQEFIES